MTAPWDPRPGIRGDGQAAAGNRMHRAHDRLVSMRAQIALAVERQRLLGQQDDARREEKREALEGPGLQGHQ